MLISESYRKQQEQLHTNPDYGVASTHFAPYVANVIERYKVKELLDYGAGKGRLAHALKGKVNHEMTIQMYDPAIDLWSAPPVPSQMVACLDVLEHIEPVFLDDVLDDLQRVTKEIGFFTVSTVPAMKKLDDGRNAHLIIESADWWLPKIMSRWDLHMFQILQDGFFVLVKPKEAPSWR